MLIENYLVMRLVYFNLNLHGVRVSVDHGCAKLGPIPDRKNQVLYDIWQANFTILLNL
jgi:hypothetical protein